MQSGPRSNSKERVHCIPQSSRITGTSPWDCLVSYPGHSLRGVLPLCRGAVSVFYSPSQLGNKTTESARFIIHVYSHFMSIQLNDTSSSVNRLCKPRVMNDFTQIYFILQLKYCNITHNSYIKSTIFYRFRPTWAENFYL